MIGSLRHRLTIEAGNPSDDGYGGQTDPWAKPTRIATVWGRIRPLRGQERLHAGQLDARHSHMITLRYRADVTTAQRIRSGARIFNIRAVTNRDERNRWLDLLCEEGAPT